MPSCGYLRTSLPLAGWLLADDVIASRGLAALQARKETRREADETAFAALRQEQEGEQNPPRPD
jgi:hypothetical protein